MVENPDCSAILIVDDEPNSRAILEAILTSERYQLYYATNGLEALAYAGRVIPDLILLDVMMPGMDGFEVCRRLRMDPILRDVPIVMISNLDDQQSRLQGLNAGADDYISKPFSIAELQARVRTITRLNRFRNLLTERNQLQEAFEATIDSWGRALEERDIETKKHSNRVTEMTLSIALEMGIEGDMLEHIRRGAMLHDIGKMGIPDAILLKQGPLTPSEWSIMKTHCQKAYDLLWPVEFLRPALDIPYSHHEKWDGTGYPKGLKGEEIPLAARIFCVVDVWDAMRNERPYHPPISMEDTLAYITSASGSHFDPRVVEVFLQIIHRNR
jgi:putative two-component system response regulator